MVIPAYNEEAVLGETLRSVARHLTAGGVAHELIVADDGSDDATVTVATALGRELPQLRVLSGPHRGKGAAVRRGMLAAAGRWVLFMDADHATPIGEWDKFAPVLAEGAAVVIGSRKTAGAQILRRQPPWREAAGRAFTWLANRILSTRVSDFTCGFKAFQQASARAIFSRQRVDGWGFDAEILFIAERLGYPIREVPVVWRDDAATKVRIARDAVRSFSELLAIRWAAARGAYRQAAPDGDAQAATAAQRRPPTRPH
ncbi:MAG TPA: dolichyl-phosphate beta-glucosyltransferase [Candidatus Limnocylindria bacterium]|nr:dolichyl-phosphate beta-glucosyltransferase [Candidatus Limnocylindria bacterium]